MIRVMLVFGTRPEAIKMCPLIKELKKRRIETVVCVSAQHRQMLDGVLEAFDIKTDFDLDAMRDGQDLFDITQCVISGVKNVIKKVKPDLILVHGDTSTAFSAALAAFYCGVKVGHVEAGLRTYDIRSPYPEEFNRRAISVISDLDFAPTKESFLNLVREGKSVQNVYVTGNTVTDALRVTLEKEYTHPALHWSGGSRLVLLTAHRRENIGSKMHSMLKAVKRIVNDNLNVKVLYPVHLNPEVKKIAKEELASEPGVLLTDPLGVRDFHNLLARSYLVLTDSGGIQEEALALGKPVLVMRDTTERPEGVNSGGILLVGTDEQEIYKAFTEVLTDERLYARMSEARNPYGDGFASVRIADVIERLEIGDAR